MTIHARCKAGLLVAASLALAVPAMAQMPEQPGTVPPIEELTPPSPLTPPVPGDPTQPMPGQPGMVPPPITDAVPATSPLADVPPDTSHQGMHEPTARQAEGEPSAGGVTTVSADDLIGRSIKDRDGKTVGTVEDIILDMEGEAVHVVLSSDDMDKKVAVTFDELRLESADADLQLSGLTQSDLEQRDAFERDSSMVSLGEDAKDDGTTGSKGPDNAGGSAGTRTYDE